MISFLLSCTIALPTPAMCPETVLPPTVTMVSVNSIPEGDTRCRKTVAEACSKRYVLAWASTSANVVRMKSGRFRLLGVAGETAVGESSSKRYRLQAGVLLETIQTLKRIRPRPPA